MHIWTPAADLHEIGTVAKAFYNDGSLVLAVDEEFQELVLQLGQVYIAPDGATYVPFSFLPEKSKHQGRKRLVVRFREIKNEAEAQELLQCRIYIPAPNMQGRTFFEPQQEISGYTLWDKKSGSAFPVSRTETWAGQGFLIVARPDNAEIMVPLVREIILEIDEAQRQITAALPEGLTDL